MVNAGRILILAKGAWSSLVTYDQLDLVTYNKIAYIARQASVGVNPATDTSYVYWMPFGSAADIATTTAPGIVMPDGVTITIDNTGLIQAVLGLADLTDVAITSPSGGQALIYDGVAQKWVNGTINLSSKVDKTDIAPVESTSTASQAYAIGAEFYYNDILYKATSAITQGGTITPGTNCTAAGSVSSQYTTLTNTLATKQNITDNTLTTTDKTVPGAINELNSGKADTTTVNNKHKVTSFEVTTSSWTQDTTSQSGTTLQKKSVSLNHVYVDSPSVEIGAASGSVLPTTAQQTAYDLLQYVTVDSAIPCLYLYASDVPTDAFYINVEGVD